MQIGSKEDRVRNPHIYLTGTLEELVRNNGAEVILEMMMNKKSPSLIKYIKLQI